MSIFKCKMCGGTIEFDEGATVGVCDSCGTKQTLPRIDDDKKANLYDRANHFRRNNEFDKAAAIYEQILNEDTTDAEAYWSLVLCQYGIEYVEDPATHKRVPTVNRAQFTSIFDDDNYKSAIEYADSMQKELYEKEAKVINDIQKGILAISQKEEPFDVFICYKETDNNGRRTPDSVLANELYHQLVEEGFKVFFARITLEDKLGTAYEPYIFAALQSSKVMVVLGTRPEYFNAVWVKNEWSRYLTLVKKSGGKKILIPAYRDMDPYDLPEEFSHLQAQDMSKLGFMQDLIRGIRKIVGNKKGQHANLNSNVSISSNHEIESYLKRIKVLLEDDEYDKANEYCEKILDIDAENSDAYFYKLLVEMKYKTIDDFQNDYKNLIDFRDGHKNFTNAIRFANEEQKDFLYNLNNGRIYRLAYELYKEGKYNNAIEILNKILDYKDSKNLIEQCENAIFNRAREELESSISNINSSKIDIDNKLSKFISLSNENENYSELINEAKYQILYRIKDSIAEYDTVKTIVKELNGYKDSEKILQDLDALINKIDERKKKFKRMMTVFSIVSIALFIVFTKFVLPAQKYNKAMNLMNSGDYKEAYEILKELNYKDSDDKLVEVNKVLLTQTQVGDYVNFGSYEQNNDTTNGKEDIEWLVLAKENNKALLISKNVLNCKPYNTSYTYVTWETCSLRKWLNEEFINDAFSPAEQQSIVSSTVTADKNPDYGTNPGNNTNDKVFLLSIGEAERYFDSDNARICSMTKFAMSEGEWQSSISMNWWWLRSPGGDPDAAAFVRYDGYLYERGYFVNYAIGVRPALCVEISNK